MTIFLDRIDSVPVINSDIDMQLMQWMAVLVDSLNEDIADIESSFNLLTAQSYTAVEIAALDVAGDLVDGVILYDSTGNVYVGRISGALVKFTTTPWP
jgi:hypothetical protein